MFLGACGLGVDPSWDGSLPENSAMFVNVKEDKNKGQFSKMTDKYLSLAVTPISIGLFRLTSLHCK
jgi:hypothetical protein